MSVNNRKRKIRADNDLIADGCVYNRTGRRGIRKDGSIFVVCNQKRRGCKVTGYMKLDENTNEWVFTCKNPSIEHSNHNKIVSLKKLVQFKKTIKKRAEKMAVGAKNSLEYEREAFENSEGSIAWPYPVARSSINRYRVENMPRFNPKTYLQFVEQLKGENCNPRLITYNIETTAPVTNEPISEELFLKTKIVGDENNPSMIFFTPQYVKFFNSKNNSRMGVDGTYKFRPHFKRSTGIKKKEIKKPYQTLLVTGSYCGKLIPVLWVLMPDKTEKSYQMVLECIRDDILPDWKPQIILSDWEIGLRNALKNTYPDATLVGCNFHYDQAILKNVNTRGLKTLYKTNVEFKIIIRALMALQLAPPNLIHELFIYIIDEMTSPELSIKLNNFFAYYYNQWIINVGAEQLSVYDKGIDRTNNSNESNNKRLNEMVKKNPTPSEFMRALLQEQSTLHRRIHMIQHNKEPCVNSTWQKNLKKQNNADDSDSDSDNDDHDDNDHGDENGDSSTMNVLKKYWTQLKEKTLSVEDFFKLCMDLIQAITIDESDDSSACSPADEHVCDVKKPKVAAKYPFNYGWLSLKRDGEITWYGIKGLDTRIQQNLQKEAERMLEVVKEEFDNEETTVVFSMIKIES